jgi:hypothetical protein
MSEWLRVEISADDEAHAAPAGGKETYCGQPVMFPMGIGEPTCPRCRLATLPDQRP